MLPDGGGRVNQLPPPALRSRSSTRSSPACANRLQARSPRAASLLERLPFATGYGVEIAMLLDVLDEVGLDGMAQVDLD